MQFMTVPKAAPGDKVAILSPSFAAPAAGPAVHEQALRRLREATGLIPVEYPTTRQLGASPLARAADLNAAFADPEIRGIFATIGGDDQITVIPHLHRNIIAQNPKPFLGYSDNTNLLNFLWSLGIAGFYGGSTQVHLGAGPRIDAVHLESLSAALIGGGEIILTNPAVSEDYGVDWEDPRALSETGLQEETDPWVWSGPQKPVYGRTWGGCVEVLDQIGLAGRFPANAELSGTILLLETSEQLTEAATVNRWLRALGERGILSQVSGVIAARPPVSALGLPRPSARERKALREAQQKVVIDQVRAYNPEAVICVGVPFGHTRPQWILPYGGYVHLDGAQQQITASYS